MMPRAEFDARMEALIADIKVLRTWRCRDLLPRRAGGPQRSRQPWPRHRRRRQHLEQSGPTRRRDRRQAAKLPWDPDSRDSHDRPRRFSADSRTQARCVPGRDQGNAERSFRDEVGCHYFDVTQDREDPLHFIFYELYLDEAAVEAHRAAPHFAEWRKAASECVVAGSQVNTLCNQRFHPLLPARRRVDQADHPARRHVLTNIQRHSPRTALPTTSPGATNASTIQAQLAHHPVRS